jgi:tetratricopeptide (TPR) repeat protein
LSCSTAFAVSVTTGETAPDFTLSSSEGPAIALHDYKGSTVVLLYFRPEQIRSRMALKDLNDIRSRYAEKGLKFIGITAETQIKELLLTELKEIEIDFPVLIDMKRDVYGSYGIRVYPSTLIIDREGKVAAVIPGHALSYKIRLEGTIRFVLGQIDASQLERIISPEKRVIDQTALYAERQYNLALRFTEARLFDQAIEFVKQSIKAKPDLIKSHILLGYLYLDAKETDNAIEQFDTALQIEPSSNDARTGLGSALIEKGKADRAIKVLNEALLMNPYPERTFYELGRAYESSGDSENAISMYHKSIEIIIGDTILPSSLAHCR